MEVSRARVRLPKSNGARYAALRVEIYSVDNAACSAKGAWSGMRLRKYTSANLSPAYTVLQMPRVRAHGKVVS
jgi:hypothetical protein